MIRIGFNAKEKQDEINEYLKNNEIKKVYIFYFKKFKPSYSIPCEMECFEYADIIEYNPFYRLCGEIDGNSLVIIDECMRTQNRSELTYNCAHHYLNQTPHKIIFEHFPFIQDNHDFMILLDFQIKGKYKGRGFDWKMLDMEDIKMKYEKLNFDIETIETTKKQEKDYLKKKSQLFDELGKKDPDTIPRNLHIFAGGFKKHRITPDNLYVARNSRYNLENVFTYKDIKEKGDYVIIDFPHNRINFNDYLKISQSKKIKFLSTCLPVDIYYQSEFVAWIERIEEFYAKTNLRK